MKVIIVGGVAGGASAAARLRRNDENAEIIMFERGEYISFANCGLPYYIGNVIEERDELLLKTPEDMKDRFNVDVRVKSEVLSIDRENKKVSVKKVDDGEIYEESYDKLILSPGSSPLKPPIPGIDSPNIFTIWNIPDTDAIKDYVDNKKIKKAAVIGGGFIGIEMAENLHDLGIEVTIVELADQIMAPIDFEMAQILHQHVNMKNVELVLNDGVKSFGYKDGTTTIRLNSDKTIEADMVILSIGVRPNGELAADSGLKTNKRCGIVVDKYMRTSDPDIYAVGDAVEINDFINDVETMIPLAGPANKQGRIAADNIAGKDVVYKGTQGTSVAKVFDMTVSATGSNEKILKRIGKEFGKDYQYIYIHPNNHAEYYPDASKINMKLLFSPLDGKILGAQAVGFEGVEKRIDVIATAIRFGGTVYDLTELELAYAPPFGSAKDPVNMAGFVAENYLKGTVDMVHWSELGHYDEKEYIVLDVRKEEELETGCFQNSVNIPLDSLRERADELDRDKLILIYCAVGTRGYIAARMLQQMGFGNVKNLSGGMTTLNSINYMPNSMLLKNILGTDNNNSNNSEENDGGNEMKKVNSIDVEKISLNCSGLQCPGPIMKVFEAIKTMDHGDLVEVTATDMGFAADITEWCKRTGNTLVDIKTENKAIVTTIMKGLKEDAPAEETGERTDKSMVIFSGDLDKVIAGFIIANGAAAMGRDVTMFFTFWGLNALRKAENVPVKKTFMEKMFGFMMPRGAGKLKLSNMNMAGMGSAMMKSIMKQKNVDTLEMLMETAKKSGVRLVVCTMSMDVMGIKKEELIDGLEYGGVASFLAASERSDATLFI